MMAEGVILTGATGFVGRAVLTELVARGIHVHAVSRMPGAPRPGVTWHMGDLLTAKGRAQVAGLAPWLIHCAWDVPHGEFWTSPRNHEWRAASRDLVVQFRSAGGARVLALGSGAEYDPHGAAGAWPEDRPLAPTSPYGVAKVGLWHDLSDLCGDALIWARLFHMFGPGEDARRLVPSLILSMGSGQRAQVRAARLVRDYAPTDHVARALVGLILTGRAGACNIGSGHPMTLGEIAQVLADALGARDRLDLSHTPPPGEPLVMVPNLTLLHNWTGIKPCDPRPALIRQAMAGTTT